MLDSTNRYLVDEATAGEPEGLVAVADFQTAGRGRIGRRWEAPAATNLLMSVLLRPRLDLGDLHLVTIAVALSAADACAEIARVRPELKWPNDLSIGGRKLAGVLAELVGARHGDSSGSVQGHADGSGRAVVVGLGLNLRWPGRPGEHVSEPVPEELESTATSLSRECALPVPDEGLVPFSVLGVVLEHLERRLQALRSDDARRELVEGYRSRCTTIGRAVSVTLSNETVEGTAVEVTDRGHLVVETSSGPRTLTAGDVVHVR